MRHGSNSRRSRGRNVGGGANNGNRRFNPKMHTYDSNGPEVRIRGNAYQIVEKYITLARDASSAGDNVLAESYYQYAEHYQRIINEFTSTIDRTESASANNDENTEVSNTAPVEKKDKPSEPVKQVENQVEKTENVTAEDKSQAPAEEKKTARKRTVREKKSETVDA